MLRKYLDNLSLLRNIEHMFASLIATNLLNCMVPQMVNRLSQSQSQWLKGLSKECIFYLGYLLSSLICIIMPVQVIKIPVQISRKKLDLYQNAC